MKRGNIVFWKERMVFGEVLDISLEEKPTKILTTFGVISVEKNSTIIEIKDYKIPWAVIVTGTGSALLILRNAWGLVKLVLEIVDYFKDRRKLFYEYLNRHYERDPS